MFYKYALSALGRLADGPAPPLSPSNRTPIFDSTPSHGIYIRPPSTAKTHSTFTDDTLYGRNWAPSPNEVKNSTQRHIAEFCYCTT